MFVKSSSVELSSYILLSVKLWIDSAGQRVDPIGFPSRRVTEEVTVQLLRSANHCIERDGILATRLCTHKDDVELTNENKLKQLPGWSFGNLILNWRCVKCNLVCWLHEVLMVPVSLLMLWCEWIWLRSSETEIISRNPPSDSWVTTRSTRNYVGHCIAVTFSIHLHKL